MKNRTYCFVLFIMVFIIFAPGIVLAGAQCDSYCFSNEYTYASCSTGGENDLCVSSHPNDWFDSQSKYDCAIAHCWCRYIYSSVYCASNQVAGAMSWSDSQGCYIQFTSSSASKGYCGVGAPYGTGADYAQCNIGKCDTSTSYDPYNHNGENCAVWRNCNTDPANSPINMVEDGYTYTWMITDIYSGIWDATNKQCVKCSGNKKTHKIGDTSGFYVSCFGTILPSGDITDTCESACGAECESSADCPTGGTCQSDCTCYIPPSGCTIPGVGTVANGACNSANKCQYCDISQSTIAWSNVPSGKVCYNNNLVDVSNTSTNYYCNYDENCDTGDCSAQKWWTSCDGLGSCRAASSHTGSYTIIFGTSDGYVLTSTCGQHIADSSYHCGEDENCDTLSTCDGWVLYEGCHAGSCSSDSDYGSLDTDDDSPCNGYVCSSTNYCWSNSCGWYDRILCSSGSCSDYDGGGSCNGRTCSVGSCTGTCSISCGAGCANDADCPGSTCNLATCICLGGPDTIPPTFSNYNRNTTLAGAPVKFSVVITDNVALSGYIFGTNNTGRWVNYTWTPLLSGGTAQNITRLNSTVGAVVNVSFYANDTSNNWAVYRASLITTESPPPPVGINPPQVRTVPITEKGTVSTDSATIWGEVTDMGGASSCLVWLEYKKDTDVIWTKACEKTITSIGTFSCDLTGLAPTTYYFKAFAKNSGSW